MMVMTSGSSLGRSLFNSDGAFFSSVFYILASVFSSSFEMDDAPILSVFNVSAVSRDLVKAIF